MSKLNSAELFIGSLQATYNKGEEEQEEQGQGQGEGRAGATGGRCH